MGRSNPLLIKVANNVIRAGGKDWRGLPIYQGSIDLYRLAYLESEAAIPLLNGEISYLTLSTAGGYGILQIINEAEEGAAIRRLEVELARTSREFYRVAEQMEFSESAFDLLVLLKKTSELSSKLP